MVGVEIAVFVLYMGMALSMVCLMGLVIYNLFVATMEERRKRKRNQQ